MSLCQQHQWPRGGVFVAPAKAEAQRRELCYARISLNTGSKNLSQDDPCLSERVKRLPSRPFESLRTNGSRPFMVRPAHHERVMFPNIEAASSLLRCDCLPIRLQP